MNALPLDHSEFDAYVAWRLDEIWGALRIHRLLMRHEWQRGPVPGVCQRCELRLVDLCAVVQEFRG